MPPPLIGQINDQTGTWRDVSQRKGVMQDCTLLIALAWFAEGVAEGPVQKEHTRRFHRDGKLAY